MRVEAQRQTPELPAQREWGRGSPALPHSRTPHYHHWRDHKVKTLNWH